MNVEIQHILAGGKAQSHDPGIDDAVKHGVELTSKAKQDAKQRRSLQCLFHDWGHQ